MRLLRDISSYVNLLSLFIMGPAIGRALLLWWDRDKKRSLPVQHIALAVSTMIALTFMLMVYGVIYYANHELVTWYTWIFTGIPIYQYQ
jgi:uncharacterized iron-regulated membrane protein